MWTTTRHSPSHHSPISRLIPFVFWTGVGVALLFTGCATPDRAKTSLPSAELTVDGFQIHDTTKVSSQIRSDFDRANDALAEGNTILAIEILERITESVPELAAAQINLGIAYAQSDELEKASTALLQATHINAKHPVAHNELGIVLRRLGKFEEAKKAYEAALSLRPNFHFARKNLAVVCDLYLRDTACALENYSLYHESNPADDTVEIWIADLKNRLGN